jgi:hypothetical protein
MLEGLVLWPGYDDELLNQAIPNSRYLNPTLFSTVTVANLRRISATSSLLPELHAPRLDSVSRSGVCASL